MARPTIFLLTLWQVSAQEISKPSFSFDSFNSKDGLSLTGSARRSKSVLRLTPAIRDQSGAAWFPLKQFVAGGFETRFRFKLTGQGSGGADGLAFVMQTSGPKALGAIGASGGFAAGDALFNPQGRGIPYSFAVFFDTFRNEYGGDPSDNFVVICANAKLKEMSWPPRRMAIHDLERIQLKDRRTHTVRILYHPPAFSVYLDNLERPIVQLSINLMGVTDADGSAFVGFTASTGGDWENHDILSWSFTALRPRVSSDISSVSSSISFQKTACLPDRPLCTPEQPTVEETGPGRFHVVLPAHLEWGASVPNPAGQAVNIRNVAGTVCWEQPEGNFTGCNGPMGSNVFGASRQGLVMPKQTPGSLVVRTNRARTYFSVNDRAGAFADNAGYFEFDVTVAAPR